MSKHQRTDLDHARDELLSYVHHCNVLQATEEQQVEWLNDTVEFLAERYPGLSSEDMEELHTIGMRFCQPVIPHGRDNTALTEWDDEAQDEQQATAGAA